MQFFKFLDFFFLLIIKVFKTIKEKLNWRFYEFEKIPINGSELILSPPDPNKLFFQEEKWGLFFFSTPDSKSFRKCYEILSGLHHIFRAWQIYQRRIQNHVKHQRWSVLRKYAKRSILDVWKGSEYDSTCITFFEVLGVTSVFVLFFFYDDRDGDKGVDTRVFWLGHIKIIWK